jgi:hypothetical protein
LGAPGTLVVGLLVPPSPASAGFPVVEVVDEPPDEAPDDPDLLVVVVVVFFVDVDWALGGDGMNSAPIAVGRWGPPVTSGAIVVVVTACVVDVVALDTGAVTRVLPPGSWDGSATV